MSMNSMPGNLTSSTYLPRPRRKRGSSLRLTLWPMPPSVAVASGMGRLPRGDAGRGAHAGGAVLNRFDDVDVARAATQVARYAATDLCLARIRVACQQRFGRHQHARRAVAALQAVLL